MTTQYLLRVLALGAALAGAAPVAGGSDATAQLKVVTSTTDLYDIAKAVGGNRITATHIGEGYQDPHFVEAKTSFAVRPGFSVTQTVAPRVGVTGFAGYMLNRPGVVYRNVAGQQFEDRWRADSIVLSVGLVYSIF